VTVEEWSQDVQDTNDAVTDAIEYLGDAVNPNRVRVFVSGEFSESRAVVCETGCCVWRITRRTAWGALEWAVPRLVAQDK
jgi:hypothetical protein